MHLRVVRPPDIGMGMPVLQGGTPRGFGLIAGYLTFYLASSPRDHATTPTAQLLQPRGGTGRI